MPLEFRKNSPSGRYYTTTICTNGKRTRLYFGSGPLGELAYLDELLHKLARELQKREWEGPNTNDKKEFP